MRFLKRINERGTVTLPAEVREALDIESGDIVEFEVLGVVRRSGKENVGVTHTNPIHRGVDQ
jgi:AbrB family looped-hinge helix DNA binding protein